MPSQVEDVKKRQAAWDAIALKPPQRWLGEHYQRRLRSVYRQLVPRGARVLELGCGNGDLLAALAPGYGLGIDFSANMIAQARARHPDLCFRQGDVHAFPQEESFDFVILSDLVNDLWDVQQVLERIHPVCCPQTRVILNTYSRLWQLPLGLAQVLSLANPVKDQNWLTVEDLSGLLYLAGFEVLRTSQEYMLPLPVPGMDGLFNRILVRLWPFYHLALANLLVARPLPTPAGERPSVSVIVPEGAKEHDAGPGRATKPATSRRSLSASPSWGAKRSWFSWRATPAMAPMMPSLPRSSVIPNASAGSTGRAAKAKGMPCVLASNERRERC